MKIQAFAILLLPLVACGSDSNNSSSCTADSAVTTTTVNIQNFAYTPACVKVASGGDITYINLDTAPHTATAKSGSAETFDSGQLAQNANYTHTFTATGTDTVYCKNHPSMTPMIVIVQ